MEDVFYFIEQSKPKTICIDIDNTIFDVNTELIKIGYSHAGKIYPIPDIQKNFFCTPEGIKILTNAEIIKQTATMLNYIREKGYSIVFATTRPAFLREKTLIQLKNIGRLSGETLYMLQDKTEVPADLFIEDDPWQIIRLLKSKRNVVAPEWEYNKFITSSNFKLYPREA